jgi:hypothetical protein
MSTLAILETTIEMASSLDGAILPLVSFLTGDSRAVGPNGIFLRKRKADVVSALLLSQLRSF